MRPDLLDPVASIVIPAFNESARIRQTILEISRELEQICGSTDWELIVADDGSSDQTAEIVAELAARDSRLRLLSLPHRGKGATVRAGMLEANGQKILFSDADLATPIREAGRLFSSLEAGADVAIGSRAAPGAQRLGEPLHREVMGVAFRYAVHLLLLNNFYDTQCGFKAFTRASAHDVFGRLTLYNDDSPVIEHASVTAFDLEVLYIATRLGYEIREVPVEWHYRRGSKVNPLRDSFTLLQDVLQVRSRAFRGEYAIAQESADGGSRPEPAGNMPMKDDPHVAG